MMHRLLLACLALAAPLTTAAAAADAGPLAAAPAREVPEAAEVRAETVADGLRLPWGLAFLPEGDMLVTERPGALRRVSADGTVSEPLGGVPEVVFGGQGGLLDVVLHPDFSSNRLVYLSYSQGTLHDNATRVARARLEADALVGTEVALQLADGDHETQAGVRSRLLLRPFKAARSDRECRQGQECHRDHGHEKKNRDRRN